MCDPQSQTGRNTLQPLYFPLVEAQVIRLVELAPGTRDEPVVIRLFIAELAEDALNQRSLTESALPIQGSAEAPGPTSVSILQEPSDREFDAQAPLISDAREARRGLQRSAPEDKQVLTSGISSTFKRSSRGTDKCPGYGADVPLSSKRRRKRLRAIQQRAFYEVYKRKDKLEAAKTE